MKNRAETPEQKREVIERLYAAWLQAPLLRLGQLIENRVVRKPVLFYVEDFQLVEQVENLAGSSASPVQHQHSWPRLPNHGVIGAVHALTESQRVTLSVCNDCQAVKVVHTHWDGTEHETVIADPFRRAERQGTG